MRLLFILAYLSFSIAVSGQQSDLQHFRPYDKTGINVFETDKRDTNVFVKTKVRVGINLAQDYQAINEYNNSAPVLRNDVDTNQLIFLTNGFNRTLANLNADIQLADGVRVNLAFYLSSQKGETGRLKGGYIQFDKLLFLKSPVVDRIMKHVTIKAGNYEVDYGDQHFRRTDGGNAMYNPFVENYIMDASTTEIGGEVYYHQANGAFALFGISNGEFDPTVRSASTFDSATGQPNKYDPAIHGKIGFDKQLRSNLRMRITGSFYTNKSASDNHLFNGELAGSQYLQLMKNPLSGMADNAGSGRYNPLFSQQVRAFAINPFVKYNGLEIFLNLENTKGRLNTEKTLRTANQFAADLLYRFPAKNDHFWIAARYNTMRAELPFIAQKVSVDRFTISAGYFLTQNLMLKIEHVDQWYGGFATTDIRYGAEFYGWMMQAVLGL